MKVDNDESMEWVEWMDEWMTNHELVWRWKWIWFWRRWGNESYEDLTNEWEWAEAVVLQRTVAILKGFNAKKSKGLEMGKEIKGGKMRKKKEIWGK